MFSTGHNRIFRLPLVVAKKVSFAIVQRLGKGMPAVAGAETWAFKNTMLAVQVRILEEMQVSSGADVATG